MSQQLRAINGKGAWFGVVGTVLAAALAAAVAGLIRAGGTQERVEANTITIRAIQTEQVKQGQDVAYIRARIDGFGEDIKQIKRAVK